MRPELKANPIPVVMFGIFGLFGLAMGIMIARDVWQVGLPFALFGVLFLVAAAIFATRPARKRRAEQRRSAALRQWATANGWAFHDGDLNASWRDDLHARRRDFAVDRAVSGTVDGASVTAAECSYLVARTTTSSGIEGGAPGGSSTSMVTEHLSVFTVRLAGHWPDLEVSRRSGMLRFAQAVFKIPSAVEFGHQAFDGRFQIATAAPEAARAVFSPVLLDAHVRGDFETWMIGGGDLILLFEGRLKPETIPAGAQQVLALASMLTRA